VSEAGPSDPAPRRVDSQTSEDRGDAPASHRSEEVGIDIIKVDRIRAALDRFGERFSKRVLTPSEQRYVRARPETFAGRWAAKEAVSKVLGLGVRGIGWRDIEIERMPTGQPAVRLHGRAAARAEQLGMDRIAVSITHESDYAVAIAFGIRTAGGRYVFPPDIEERLDDRERRILARMERLRELHEEAVRVGDATAPVAAATGSQSSVESDGGSGG
jgi:holo-[acyl-carrier protein] synthase